MHTSRSGPWRVQHHGSRPFGTREEVATYKLSKSIEILWLEDADHDLKPRKAVSGFTAADHMVAMADRVGSWAKRLASQGGK